jgi:antitoxin ParD1/3/4
MASLVWSAVESGAYATTSEVLREALRDWKQRRALQPRDIKELRPLWGEGLASGPGALPKHGRGQGAGPSPV